jgi:F420 biosynthesis protein FbiB-like protein
MAARAVAMNADILSGIIENRRSVRRYLPQPVPDTLVERLLRAATWAPSAHNRQPWRFVVVKTPETRARLVELMAARWRDDLTADGLLEDEIARQVDRSRGRLSAAPALIVLCVTLTDMDQYPDTHRQSYERIMAIQGVAMAGQNLLLMAHAEGLGACWMCAPLFCPDVVRAALDLPEDYEAMGLITLGYPAETRTKERHPLKTRVLWR